jgi:hypothetical protein
VDLVSLGPTTSTVFAAKQGAGSSGPGIYKSVDGGKTWTFVKSFAVPFRLTHRGSTVYAATSNGLYFSDSSSNYLTWTRVSGGIPDGSVSFVGTVLVNATVHMYAMGPDGLYRSVNGGSSWQLVMPGQAVGAVSGTTNCTSIPNTTVFAGGLAGPGLSGSLWISSDSGLTWSSSSFPTGRVNDLWVKCGPAPLANRLFVTNGDPSFTTPVWRSDDAGATFVPDSNGIAALDYVASNIHDPGDSGNFYLDAGSAVGTLGGGDNGDGMFVRDLSQTFTWNQWTLAGLSNLQINRWVRVVNPATGNQRFVVATPSALQYWQD